MTSPLGAELRRVHDTLRADLRALQAAAATGAPPESRRTLPAHCLAFCAALTAHHTGEDAGAFPALVERFPELARQLAQEGTSPRLAGELDGLAAIAESHFSFEERRIAAALDRLPGTPALLGQEKSAL